MVYVKVTFCSNLKIIIKWQANFLLTKVVVINHGISRHDDDGSGGGGGGGSLSRETFRSGPIWLRKWSDMPFKVVRYHFQYYHIGPLSKPYRTTLKSFHFFGIFLSRARCLKIATVSRFWYAYEKIPCSFARWGGGDPPGLRCRATRCRFPVWHPLAHKH